MKKVLLIALIIATSIGGYAKKVNQNNSLVVGTWKYTRSSSVNSLQKLSSILPALSYKSEYFVFQPDNKFKHEFVDENNNVVKTIKGTWKLSDNKIKISYSDIDFQFVVDYFFLDKDLVLGQNFNHIIFTKDVLEDRNIALK